MTRRIPTPRSKRPSSAGGASSNDGEIPYASELQRAGHDLSRFACGKPELDHWLRQSALHADAAGTGRTYVWADDAQTVVAYYTLVPHTVDRELVPRSVGRGGPKQIPAILLARLALTTDLHGRGWGEALLTDALERALEGIAVVSGRLIVVDAIDEDAVGFYSRYGFKRTAPESRRMFMKASDAFRALGVTFGG